DLSADTASSRGTPRASAHRRASQPEPESSSSSRPEDGVVVDEGEAVDEAEAEPALGMIQRQQSSPSRQRPSPSTKSVCCSRDSPEAKQCSPSTSNQTLAQQQGDRPTEATARRGRPTRSSAPSTPISARTVRNLFPN
ncbi:MAG: hypothetical protein AAFP90_24705, partial [Planctomycetota bacterium]